MNRFIKWLKENLSRDPAYVSRTLYMDPSSVPEFLTQYEHPMTKAHYDSGPHAGCQCRVCGLQRTLTDLQIWKNAEEKVVADLDLPGIAKELNLDLSVGVSKQILPAIKKLNLALWVATAKCTDCGGSLHKKGEYCPARDEAYG